jgi:hypothetical protein
MAEFLMADHGIFLDKRFICIIRHLSLPVKPMGNKRVLVMVVLFLLIATTLFAEIAPEEYEKMKRNSTEQLELLIRTVKRSGGLFSRNIEVKVKATVTAVHQSLSRLSVGDSITITYEIYKPPRVGWVGPRPIPLLKKGEELPAFLFYDQESKTYIPAARGASFESLSPAR